MGIFGIAAEKFIRPFFATRRIIPGLNLVRPPTITTPEGKTGVFSMMELNEKGKWNIHLNNGDVIYNVEEENMKVVTGNLSLLAGDAVVAINMTSSGTIIPWDKLSKNEANTEIIKTQRDYWQSVAMSSRDDLQTAAGGNKLREAMEEQAEAMGRVQSKIHGKMVFGRQEIAEHMTPELEQLIGGGMGTQNEGE